MSIMFIQICINEEMLPKVGKVFTNGPEDLGSIQVALYQIL